MVTVPYRRNVTDQMQDGRPAADALTVDSQHTGNGSVQKPLRSHKIILFLGLTRTGAWRPRARRSKVLRSSSVDLIGALTWATFRVSRYQPKKCFIRHDN